MRKSNGWSTKILIVALLAVLPTVNVRAADNAKLKAEVTALLTDGWTLGPDGLAAARGHFETARTTAPTDLRPLWAMAVTEIRQRRYADAAKTLDEILEHDAAHLTAWQAKIWLSMVARKYDAALADVETLVEHWPKAGDSSEVEAREDASRFLGRVLGYLWGPATGKVADDRLTEIEQQIEAKLESTDKTAFTESRGTVLGKFTDLQDKTETTREKAKAEEEKSKEQDRERLAAEKQNVNAEKGTIDQQANLARATAQSQLQTLATALQALDAQFNQLSARAAPIQAQIASFVGQEQLLITRANSTKDRFEKSDLLNQAQAIAALRFQAEAAYAQLDAQARGVNSQRQANLQQQNQVNLAYQGEMKRLGMKADTLVKTEKRISGELKKANTAATGVTAGVRNLSTTSAVFVTYYDFPVEREKRRIIDSFK
ncbi:MAG: hypothetical protein JNM18_24605 [Planctomycetaceae bacterium]|nr:hypothetical protein [Planctomycetaceae bacterium]